MHGETIKKICFIRKYYKPFITVSLYSATWRPEMNISVQIIKFSLTLVWKDQAQEYIRKTNMNRGCYSFGFMFKNFY